MVVVDKVEDNELVWISLNGFSPQWHDFVQVICCWEKLLDFDDDEPNYKEDDELDLVLIRKVGRGGRKGGFGRG